jgi:hypothetical protein
MVNPGAGGTDKPSDQTQFFSAPSGGFSPPGGGSGGPPPFGSQRPAGGPAPGGGNPPPYGASPGGPAFVVPSGGSGGGGRKAAAVLGVLVLIGAGVVGGYFIGHHNKSSGKSSTSAIGGADEPKLGACVAADSAHAGAGHFRFNTSACENGTYNVTSFVLPLHKGLTASGKTTWYVIMDTSSKALSDKLGVNYSPRLANAKGTKGVQQVTVGSDGTVKFSGTVDFSGHRVLKPGPDGFPPSKAVPQSKGDANYSPLIQLPDGTVENAPQIANDTGTADKAVTLDKKNMKVVYQAQHGFYENKSVHYASFDATDPVVAAIEDVTYTPNLKFVPSADDDATPSGDPLPKTARETLITFINGPAQPGNPLDQGQPFALDTGGPNPTPLNLLHEVPQIANHDDVGCVCYTPMWDVHLAEWTKAAVDNGDRTQYRDVNTVIDTLTKKQPDGTGPFITGPNGSKFKSSGIIVNCPLVSIDVP